MLLCVHEHFCVTHVVYQLCRWRLMLQWPTSCISQNLEVMKASHAKVLQEMEALNAQLREVCCRC